jgi:hypothetical protein
VLGNIFAKLRGEKTSYGLTGKLGSEVYVYPKEWEVKLTYDLKNTILKPVEDAKKEARKRMEVVLNGIVDAIVNMLKAEGTKVVNVFKNPPIWRDNDTVVEQRITIETPHQFYNIAYWVYLDRNVLRFTEWDIMAKLHPVPQMGAPNVPSPQSQPPSSGTNVIVQP